MRIMITMTMMMMRRMMMMMTIYYWFFIVNNYCDTSKHRLSFTIIQFGHCFSSRCSFKSLWQYGIADLLYFSVLAKFTLYLSCSLILCPQSNIFLFQLCFTFFKANYRHFFCLLSQSVSKSHISRAAEQLIYMPPMITFKHVFFVYFLACYFDTV